MLKKWNTLKMAGVFLLLLVLAVVARPETAKAAAEKIELNRSYTVQLDSDHDSFLYEFRVPETGNISVQVKNADPVGDGEMNVQLYDSNNLALTNIWHGKNVELPVYSTDGNKTFYLTLSGYNTREAVFLLTVNFEPTTDWESEGNDTTAMADLITAGKKWYGAINDQNDSYDYFKFKLTANKKVSITFGPKEVSGKDYRWDVCLINSGSKSLKIYDGSSTTQTYSCYLKKGTYYLQVARYNDSKNIMYALSYKESAIKLVEPTVSSIKCTGYKSVFGNFVELDKIKIKNSGDANGYTVKVSNKKNMGKPNTTEEIEFDNKNTKKLIALQSHFVPNRYFYVQVRSYVKDPFGVKIATGKYGAVKGLRISNSLYKKLME